MLQKKLQSPEMPNYANLRSRPKIEAIKPSKRDTEFYRHDGDALQGLRLAVGAQAKTWIMSKRINGKVRSITLGHWPEFANGDAAMEVAREKIAALEAGTDATTTQVVTLKNTAGNGTFKLANDDGSKISDAIALDADLSVVAAAMSSAFGTVSVTGGEVAGNERVYTLVFTTDPGEVLGAAAQVDGKDVEVEVEKDDDKQYEITFKGGFADSNVPTLVADATELMGAFGFDLGASLGDLASIETSGSFSPLANLHAAITFGLDLSPSQELAVGPQAFSPSPRVLVNTTS